MTVLNKALQSKPKSQQPVRRKTTAEEGAGSSRPQSVKRPRPVSADSKITTPSATHADSETPMPSGNRQTTPSKRPKESSMMTIEPNSPELRMRDKTVSYIDLLRPGPPPLESSKKFAKWS
jgi:hypothetical protein